MKSRRSMVPIVAALSVSQIIGWGTTFYLPSVLAPPLAMALGVSRELIFAGPAVMIAVGAVLSPRIGRVLDARGAGAAMATGSVAIAAGFAMLAAWPSLAVFVFASVLFGVAMPLALSLAALTLITQLTGEARRSIGILMLFTGLSASIFWPLTSWLDHVVGWRATLVVFAALNLAVALPLHLALARAQRIGATAREVEGRTAAAAPVIMPRGTPRRRLAAVLLVVSFTAQGVVSWGLPLHLIALFEQLGLAPSLATGIAALNGPATIAARLLEIMVARRLKTLTTGLVATAVLPLSLGLFLIETPPLMSAVAFVLLWSGAAGVMSIVRATLPLAIFGREGYGAMMGRLALPQNLAFAASPLVFAFLIEGAGLRIGIVMAIVLSTVSLVALLFLARLLRDAGAVPLRQ